MTTEIANTFCFIIASLTFAAIFHDNINYIAHHKSDHGEEVRLSHSLDEHVSRFQGNIKTGGSASVHQQSSCSVLPSGCALKP
jgi:hypothetical protein